MNYNTEEMLYPESAKVEHQGILSDVADWSLVLSA